MSEKEGKMWCWSRDSPEEKAMLEQLSTQAFWQPGEDTMADRVDIP